jgi:hypothetical protein
VNQLIDLPKSRNIPRTVLKRLFLKFQAKLMNILLGAEVEVIITLNVIHPKEVAMTKLFIHKDLVIKDVQSLPLLKT